MVLIRFDELFRNAESVCRAGASSIGVRLSRMVRAQSGLSENRKAPCSWGRCPQANLPTMASSDDRGGPPRLQHARRTPHFDLNRDQAKPCGMDFSPSRATFSALHPLINTTY